MSWVVYTTSSGALVSAERTEAHADTTIAAGTGRSKLEVNPLPADFRLEHYRVDTSGPTLVYKAFTDMTDVEQAAELKTTVKTLALVFDDGLKFHWAGQKSASNVRPSQDLSTAANTQRYDNTDVWARAWIGAAWRECDRLENSHSDALSLSDVKKIVAQAKAEIDIGIRKWYTVHTATAGSWNDWLFDGTDDVVMYRTDTSTGGGVVMTDPVMTYSQAEWSDLIDDQYFAALVAAS